MSIQLSGSLVITGSITTTGVITMSGSIASASYSSTSDLLQGTGSVGFATTASLLAVSSSQQQISASLLNVIAVYATTGSNSFRANQSITGSLVVSSTITAQTLVVQTVTSSIVYSSGSNSFGNELANTQTFTGSLNVTGSSHAIFGNVGIGITPNITAGITELAIGSSNTNPLISGIRDGVSAFSLSSDSAGTKLFERRNLNLILGTNNTARLTIADNGAATFACSVGIGTNVIDCYTGYSVLQVQGSNGAIIQTSDGSVKTALVSNCTGFGIVATRTNHGLKIYTNDIERLHITNTGISTFACQVCVSSLTSCGIITANNNGAAQSILQSVMSYADGYRATLRLNNAHTGGNIWELYSTNSSDGNYGGGKLAFKNTTTDVYAMTITCAGNIGMGTLNPTGAAGLTLAINGGSSQTRIALKNSTTGDNAGSGFQIGLSGLSAFIEQRENDILTLSTSAIERMRISGTGITSFTCQVCATSGVRFGNGSSTINYYCSADWAPAFYAGGSTSFGLTTQTGTGKFTRIGNVVILHGQISWTGAGSGGANLLSIQNLPFPAVCTARGGATPGLISGISNIASGGLNLVVEIGSCIIYLTTNCGNGGPHIHLTGDAVTSGGSRLFAFGGSYITNDAS